MMISPVEQNPPSARVIYGVILDRMKDKYGPPTENRDDVQVGRENYQVTWRFPPTTINLGCVVSSISRISMVLLSYEKSGAGSTNL